MSFVSCRTAAFASDVRTCTHDDDADHQNSAGLNCWTSQHTCHIAAPSVATQGDIRTGTTSMLFCRLVQHITYNMLGSGTGHPSVHDLPGSTTVAILAEELHLATTTDCCGATAAAG
jgi:hypothetical protein